MGKDASKIDRSRNAPTQSGASFWLPRIIISLGIVYVLFRAVLELHQALPAQGEPTSVLTTNWNAVFAGLVALSVLIFLGAMVAVWFPDKARSIRRTAIAWRERLGWLRWPVAIVIAAAPAYLHLYSPLGNALTGPHTRLLSISITGLLVQSQGAGSGGVPLVQQTVSAMSCCCDHAATAVGC